MFCIKGQTFELKWEDQIQRLNNGNNNNNNNICNDHVAQQLSL